MDAITGFLEDFDFAKLLPEIGKFLGSLRFWINFMMILGPLVLLGFGLWYYFRPVSQINDRLGFRIRLGMTSSQAWQFTQRLAGVIWGVMGAAMTAVTIIICLICLGTKLLTLATVAVVWLVIEALLTLISYFAMQYIVASHFHQDGTPKAKE